MTSATAEKTDMVKLYSKEILKFSSDIPCIMRLENPDATVTRRSPLCGSTITVDVKMHDGRVVAFGQDVKACALGNATASIVGGSIIGRTYEELVKTRDDLRTMLKGTHAIESQLFPDLRVLQAAQAYPNRHASVMLVLDATVEAIKQIRDAS